LDRTGARPRDCTDNLWIDRIDVEVRSHQLSSMQIAPTNVREIALTVVRVDRTDERQGDRTDRR
jgi:hypothetical protein